MQANFGRCRCCIQSYRAPNWARKERSLSQSIISCGRAPTRSAVTILRSALARRARSTSALSHCSPVKVKYFVSRCLSFGLISRRQRPIKGMEGSGKCQSERSVLPRCRYLVLGHHLANSRHKSFKGSVGYL